MGYSSNPVTVHNNAELLAPLLTGSNYVWTNLPNPRATAYKLRECIRIACLYPDQFPRLAQLGPRYRISVVNGTVAAQYFSAEELKIEKKDVAAVLNNPISVMDIVQFWLDQPEPRKPILVTAPNLTNAEIGRLEHWASKLDPKWKVVVGEGTIRLEPTDA